MKWAGQNFSEAAMETAIAMAYAQFDSDPGDDVFNKAIESAIDELQANGDMAFLPCDCGNAVCTGEAWRLTEQGLDRAEKVFAQNIADALDGAIAIIVPISPAMAKAGLN